MKFLILFATALLAVNAASLSEQWQAFKVRHGKSYKSTVEESKRFAIFQENLLKIEQHNVKYEKGESSFKMGVNRFADMTLPELKALMLLPDITRPRSGKTFDIGTVNLASLPESIDWETKGAVTEVRNQGDCGSCYAFSTIESIESAHFQKTGELVDLSEQQIIDCSTPFGNQGCDGGFPQGVFEYVIKNGVAKLDDYPYTATEQTCTNATSYVWIDSYVQIEPNEDDLKAAVGTVGPISVTIHAEDLFHYESGVFDDVSCPKQLLDHAVLLVGYGTADGKDYWRFKNSWGTEWGEEGYARVVRDYDICGIADDTTYPVLAE